MRQFGVMPARVLLLRYGWSVGLREFLRLRPIRPEVRLGVSAAAGALISPFVVFVGPFARVYWLLTGKHVRWPFGVTAPRPYVVVNPFESLADSLPADVREMLERHGHPGQPVLIGESTWMEAWARVGQLLNWQLPVGYGDARRDGASR
jgi:hypothetical protein